MDFYKFIEFIKIMKNIPTFAQVEELTESNENLPYIEKLASLGYFKLLDPEQIYHLFVNACVYESVDIALLLYKNNIDLIGVKEFMCNYLIEFGTNSDYFIFRWVWEKEHINFTSEEKINCFIKILKSNNLEFAEWFRFNSNIDIHEPINKHKIAWEVLSNANTKQDFLTNKFISEQYLKS